jgi:hypothetical protein
VFEAANQPPPLDDAGLKWKKGEQEFEALMKHLDNAGYRTGYPYREATATKLEKSARQNNDVVVPPASSSFVYVFDDDTNKKGSPMKSKGVGKQKENKSDWLTTGKREELDETLNSNLDTTKTSKWAPEDTSTPIKPDRAARPDSREQGQGKPFESLMEESTVVHGGSEEPRATQMTLPVNQSASPKKDAQAENGNKSSGKPTQLDSPQKSTSSAEGVLDERESSPGRDLDSSAKDKKKKKGGFRMPSFGGKKKEK